MTRLHGWWLAIGLAGLVGGPAFAAPDARIDAVFLAQTHAMQPDQPYFRLVGNRDTLLKVHVVAPSGGPAPAVTAIIESAGTRETATLRGPFRLPTSLPRAPGEVEHRFDDSFTTMIPARLVRPGMVIEVRAGPSRVVRHEIAVGAPTIVQMKMFDVHYFGKGGREYPEGFLEELESKWPVADLQVERVRGIKFPQLVIPARGGLPAVRVSSPEEYRKKTGQRFDGEQAAALQWVHALSAAGGNQDVAMCYINIHGVPAGGQAGGFDGVGGISHGIFHHELGHALSLPHIGDSKKYPYRGEMHGIPPPQTYNEVHVGPTWAFDLPSRTFIPPTVQQKSRKGQRGTYKADPMQGGGTGDQEAPFLYRHFSDYNVHQMQRYLEGKVAVRRVGAYYKWNEVDGDYTQPVKSDGVRYPIQQDVPVISVMASLSLADRTVNMIYPPIGPYRGNLIRTFDPRNEHDRAEARRIFAPSEGCDFTLKIVQGGHEHYYLLPAGLTEGSDPLQGSSLKTAAVNLPARDGPVTRVSLLHTPDAERNGIPPQAEVLARWPAAKDR